MFWPPGRLRIDPCFLPGDWRLPFFLQGRGLLECSFGYTTPTVSLFAVYRDDMVILVRGRVVASTTPGCKRGLRCSASGGISAFEPHTAHPQHPTYSIISRQRMHVICNAGVVNPRLRGNAILGKMCDVLTPSNRVRAGFLDGGDTARWKGSEGGLNRRGREGIGGAKHVTSGCHFNDGRERGELSAWMGNGCLQTHVPARSSGTWMEKNRPETHGASVHMGAAPGP